MQKKLQLTDIEEKLDTQTKVSNTNTLLVLCHLYTHVHSVQMSHELELAKVKLESSLKQVMYVDCEKMYSLSDMYMYQYELPICHGLQLSLKNKQLVDKCQHEGMQKKIQLTDIQEKLDTQTKVSNTHYQYCVICIHSVQMSHELELAKKELKNSLEKVMQTV